MNIFSQCSFLVEILAFNLIFKVHSHVTSAFAFFFDLCHPILKNANVILNTVTCSHRTPFLTFVKNANVDVTCEQDFSNYFCVLSFER